MNKQKVFAILGEIEKEANYFPFYNPAEQKNLKFGQYITTIEKSRKKFLELSAELREEVVRDLQSLSEQESKKLITEMIVCMPNSEVYNDVAIFLTKLYDRGYAVCRKIDKKEAQKVESE